MICSDIDDTLLNSERTYSPLLADSIARYTNAGGKFVIVTGRMTLGAIHVAKSLDLHGEILTFQGAMASDIDSGKILSSICIDTHSASMVCEYLESQSWYFHTYLGDAVITQKANEFTKMYTDISNVEYIETKIPMSEYLVKNGMTPPKIVICENEELVPSILKDVKEKFCEKFWINTSKPWIVEIVPKNINKGVGVARLAEKYRISKEEIICIGDSDNDIEMLQYAGLGVAVGNASPSVKRAADLVAPSCDDNGVGWVIDNYGFLK